MSLKNTKREFIKDGIYHIYNRGVEKRNIFLDEEDYKIFLYYLKTYLVPPDTEKKTPINITRLGSNFDLYKNIQLLCYVLMSNHFHFVFKQFSEKAITEFMRRLTIAYVRYFNNKYKRVGPLFQGRYKSVLVDKDDYFLYLSSYVHINPIELSKYSEINTLEHYPYSSYSDYIGKINTPWIHEEYILNYINDKEDKFLFYKNQTEQLALESDKYKKEFSSLLLE
jgi:putative transposase